MQSDEQFVTCRQGGFVADGNAGVKKEPGSVRGPSQLLGTPSISAKLDRFYRIEMIVLTSNECVNIIRQQFMTRGAQMTTLSSLSILGAAFALAACSHARPVADAAAGAQPAAPQLSVEQKAPTPVVATPRAEGQAELDVALAALRGVSLYFAFDEATLTPQATDKLAKVGDVLQRHSGLSIRIEGNCDERGSEAYNIALGQRRADAAKKYLVRFGARPEQIQAISYGKERPKAPGHDETAWAQNRRDDLLPR